MDAYTRINGYKHAMRELSDIFKALGDETRLQILALLLEHGELCVCDIENVIGASQSKTSRHLRYLLHAGLVQDRREGVWQHYSIPNWYIDHHRLAYRSRLAMPGTPPYTLGLRAWWQKPTEKSSR